MSNVCVEEFNFKSHYIFILDFFCFMLGILKFGYLIVVSHNLHRLHVASDILHRTPLIP